MKIEIYTDGSYTKVSDPDNVYGGIIILADGKPIMVARVKSKDSGMVSAWNAGGELLATMYGVTAAYSLMAACNDKVDNEVTVYHDYNGVANFMIAPPGQSRPWIPKKPASRKYVGVMNSLKNRYPYTIKYVWVKGHSGNRWNEVVDDITGGRYSKHSNLPELIELEDI